MHKYNEHISDNKLAVSNTFYYPLGQNHIIVTADLTQEILWNKPPALTNKVTMQLGGMQRYFFGMLLYTVQENM